MKKQNLSLLAAEYLELQSELKERQDRMSDIRAVFQTKVGSRAVVDGYKIEWIKGSSERMISKEAAVKKHGIGFLKLHKLVKKVVSRSLSVKKLKK